MIIHRFKIKSVIGIFALEQDLLLEKAFFFGDNFFYKCFPQLEITFCIGIWEKKMARACSGKNISDFFGENCSILLITGF